MTSQFDEIGRCIDEVYNGSQGYLESLARIWDQNIQFYEGNQWVQYNQQTRRYQDIPLTPKNRFIPRPVDNQILPIVQTITSIFTRNRATASVRPNSTNEADINAAKISERIVDGKWEIDNEDINYIQAAKIALLTGTVFRKDYWDPSKGPFHQQLGASIGDNAVSILDAFRVIPDLQAKSWFIESSVQTLGWIRSRFNKESPGYTGLAGKVKEETGLSNLMQIHNNLKVGTSSGSDGNLKNCVVVKECYIAPTDKYPDGLMVIMAGPHVLYINKSPYFDPRYEDSWHPYSIFKWEDPVFRFHGISLVENLVPLQKKLNSIDSIVELSRRTMVNPIWMIPNGCGLAEGYLTGAPGLNVIYNPVGASGARPERVPGVGLPADVYREREMTLEQLHSIAGDNQVLQGQRPQGVNTASQMSMMLEQSFSKFSTPIQQWEKFIESSQTKKLRLIAKNYQEPRPELYKTLKALNRDNLEVEIKDFLGSDLRDNVNVRIEAGSNLPKSKIAEQQNYKDLAGMGLFGPLDPSANPIGNQEFLEKFGVEKIQTDLNADVRRARWINSVLLAINRGDMGPESYPPILPVDNLMIHQKVLSDAVKAPGFQDTNRMFERRLTEINQILQQQQMAQQQALAPPPYMPQELPRGNGVPNTEGPEVATMQQ